jgi:hypothetical protein
MEPATEGRPERGRGCGGRHRWPLLWGIILTIPIVLGVGILIYMLMGQPHSPTTESGSASVLRQTIADPSSPGQSNQGFVDSAESGFVSSREPAANGMLGCPHAGKWAISVWDGADGTSTGQALATCGAGAVAAAYALDPQTQMWLRYFDGRPGISNLLAIDHSQGVLALGALAGPTATPAPDGTGTPTPNDTPATTGTLTATTTPTPTSTATPVPSAVSVSMSPSTQSVSPGEAFQVDLVIDTDTPSRGAQASLTFDPVLVEVTEVTEGDFFKAWAEASGNFTLLFPEPTIDNVAGEVSGFSVAVIGTNPGGPTGSGLLWTYHMTAKAEVTGTSDLVLADVVLADALGSGIPGVDVNDGKVVVE